MPDGSIGGQKETRVCPLPRSWYPADSPCSRTDDVLTGDPQEPQVQIPQEGWTWTGSDLASWGKLLLAVFVLWLLVRAYEAYKR